MLDQSSKGKAGKERETDFTHHLCVGTGTRGKHITSPVPASCYAGLEPEGRFAPQAWGEELNSSTHYTAFSKWNENSPASFSSCIISNGVPYIRSMETVLPITSAVSSCSPGRYVLSKCILQQECFICESPNILVIWHHRSVFLTYRRSELYLIRSGSS